MKTTLSLACLALVLCLGGLQPAQAQDNAETADKPSLTRADTGGTEGPKEPRGETGRPRPTHLDQGGTDDPKAGDGAGKPPKPRTHVEIPPSVDTVSDLSCAAIGFEGGGPNDGVLRNVWFENHGSGPIPAGTVFTVVTSDGQTLEFEVYITLQPGQGFAMPNVFPNGVPEGFRCETIFA